MIERTSQTPEPASAAPRKMAREAARGDFGACLEQAHAEADADARLAVASSSELTNSAAPLAPQQSHQQLELHVRDAAGLRDTISLPWRLVATGRLDWAIQRGRGGVEDADPSRRGGISQVQSSTSMGMLQPWLHRGTAPTLNRPPVSVSHANQSAPSAQLAADDEGSAAGSRAQLLLAADTWRERLIRWIERQGHDAAVWVRDYRLDEGGARDMAESLRASAREHGFELERIVINAREVWHAQRPGNNQELG